MVQKGDFSCICGISTLEHTCPKNLNRPSDSPRNSASFDTKVDEKKVSYSVVIQVEKAKKKEISYKIREKSIFAEGFRFYHSIMKRNEYDIRQEH